MHQPTRPVVRAAQPVSVDRSLPDPQPGFRPLGRAHFQALLVTDGAPIWFCHGHGHDCWETATSCALDHRELARAGWSPPRLPVAGDLMVMLSGTDLRSYGPGATFEVADGDLLLLMPCGYVFTIAAGHWEAVGHVVRKGEVTVEVWA